MSLADDLMTGKQYFDVGQYDAALHWFENILAQLPNQPDAMQAAAITLNALGRAADALTMFEKLQRLDGRKPEYYHGTGEALQQLGRIGEARSAFERAIALAPTAVHHHYGLARLLRFQPGDAHLAALVELAKGIDRLSDPEKVELHFALGKAYDDLGRADDAFRHLAAGNALRRRTVKYDETMSLGLLRAMAEAFTPDAIAPSRLRETHPTCRYSSLACRAPARRWLNKFWPATQGRSGPANRCTCISFWRRAILAPTFPTPCRG